MHLCSRQHRGRACMRRQLASWLLGPGLKNTTSICCCCNRSSCNDSLTSCSYFCNGRDRSTTWPFCSQKVKVFSFSAGTSNNPECRDGIPNSNVEGQPSLGSQRLDAFSASCAVYFEVGLRADDDSPSRTSIDIWFCVPVWRVWTVRSTKFNGEVSPCG